MSKTLTLQPPFVAVCVDDTARPPEIPENKWVEKDKHYTVNKVVPTIDGKIGFVIDKLDLGIDTFPYDCISPRRFAILMPTVEDQADQAVDGLLKETKISKEA